MCVCVCACVRACMRACVRACVCVCVVCVHVYNWCAYHFYLNYSFTLHSLLTIEVEVDNNMKEL